MSEREALQGFLDKFRAKWPEWAVADAFVPAAQREFVHAWLALRDELTEAAWGGEDARPGEAKLVWWAEELAGWSRGARRHPLGLVLQKQDADWAGLAASLPALAATRRQPPELEAALQALVPFAGAVSATAQRLFGEAQPAASLHNVAISLLAARLLRGEEAPDNMSGNGQRSAEAQRLLAVWSNPSQGTRPGRIHAAILRRRLSRLAAGREGPASRFATLFDAWRAARG